MRKAEYNAKIAFLELLIEHERNSSSKTALQLIREDFVAAYEKMPDITRTPSEDHDGTATFSVNEHQVCVKVVQFFEPAKKNGVMQIAKDGDMFVNWLTGLSKLSRV